MCQPLPCITEDLESLQARLRSERDPQLRPRLHLLVLLKSRQVTTRRQAAAHLAVHRNTVALWLRTYREGGLTLGSGPLRVKPPPLGLIVRQSRTQAGLEPWSPTAPDSPIAGPASRSNRSPGQ